MDNKKVSRILFYLSALLSLIILVAIVISDSPIGEMKAPLMVLAGTSLTTIAMAITSSKKKNVDK
jgi:urea transporter